MGTASQRPVDTVATYTCDTGYTLNGGNTTRTCGSDGVWSGSAPTCQATCSENLPLISNGGITYVGGSTDNRPVGTMAIYSCFGDNRLVGVAVRTCQSNGTWSSTTAPVCEEICSDLSSPTNGIVDYGGGGSMDNRPADTVATYNCDTGYTLNGGNNIRTCGSDGMWSGLAPTCQAICPDLIVSVNGVVNYSPATTPRLEGTTVTQSCLNGYVPSTTTRVCLTTRSWSGSALTYEVSSVFVSVFIGTTNVAMNSQVAIDTIGEDNDLSTYLQH
ncbi:E-selectin-like isoform X3 [Halichondria panicea]|uniref:E-selectin-like isoform X3 n=1 Tax=Halichondria panicea TaxID=6063 RepID=UPI00312B2AF0